MCTGTPAGRETGRRRIATGAGDGNGGAGVCWLTFSFLFARAS
jgi:hypothetical protein